MTRKRMAGVAVAVWGLLAVPVWTAAQATVKPEAFRARLAWVPTAGTARVTGKGAASATLTGKSLAIAGSFEGLSGAATVARLHQGIAKGARGRVIADVQVPKTASATFTATVTLNDEQVEALKQGKVYLQLHSDKGLDPDGANLWGWFLR